MTTDQGFRKVGRRMSKYISERAICSRAMLPNIENFNFVRSICKFYTFQNVLCSLRRSLEDTIGMNKLRFYKMIKFMNFQEKKMLR